jgi:hypothetical protein
MNIHDALETLGLYCWLDANERHVSAGLQAKVDEARQVVGDWIDAGTAPELNHVVGRPPAYPHPVESQPPRKMVMHWPLGSDDAVGP